MLSIKQIIKWILYIVVVCLLIYFLEWWGVLGLLLFLLVFTIYKVAKNKEILLSLIRMTETSIFGKPLDKENWAKGEMHHTHVKIYWGESSLVDWNKFITILLYPSLICMLIGYSFNNIITLWIGFVSMGLLVLFKIIFWVRSKYETRNKIRE